MGSNGDSHNHNDTGSITVYKNGRPFLIDVGVESYTQKTFSPQRYEIWTMQSSWHNLPAFDGVQQAPGAEYAASGIRTGPCSISAELAGAWPPVEGLESYRRTVSVSEQGVTVQDVTDWPGQVELTLMTQARPVPAKDGLHLEKLGRICFDPDTVEAAVQPVRSQTPGCVPPGRKRSIGSRCISVMRWNCGWNNKGEIEYEHDETESSEQDWSDSDDLQ